MQSTVSKYSEQCFQFSSLFSFSHWFNVSPSNILVSKQAWWTTLGILTFNWKTFSLIICGEIAKTTLEVGRVERKVSTHVNCWVGRRKVLNRCLLKIRVRDRGPQCHCQSHADARGILWLWRKLIVGTEGSSCSARQHWCQRGNKGCCLRAQAHAK